MIIFMFVSAPEGTFADSKTRIFVNGNEVKFKESLFIEGGRLYVPLRFISEELNASVVWNAENRSVSMTTALNDHMTFIIDSSKIFLNDNQYFIDAPPLIRYDRTYLPIRHVAELNHTYIKWDSRSGDTYLNEAPVHTVQPGETLAAISQKYSTTVELLKVRNGLKGNELFVGDKLKVIIPQALSYHPDIDLLAKLIHAESGGEPFVGKVAVGNVIMNRVEDSRFPNTIKGVIYQQNQFTPVKTGKINYVDPSSSSIEAAERALAGEEPVKNALFFFNPSLTKDVYLHEKKVIAKIGNHEFLR